MFRNNLFIKIYLSFWLAMLFMIGAVVTVDWLTETGPFRSGHLFPQGHGGPLSVQGRAAIWIYEREGPESFRKFADHVQGGSGMRVDYFDESARELTGRTDPKARELAALVLKSAGEDVVHSENGGLTALRIAGSSGKAYAVVGHFSPRPHPPGGPDSYGMTAVRLLILLIVSGAICFLLARYLTAPILGLGAAARRLAAGDLSARFGPELGRRSDEISRLALDFDGMAERIGSLLTSQRTLLRDISHELRSPLARLCVALELCRQRSGPEAGKHLDRIEHEAGKLNEMIEQLLMLNRAESGVSPERTRIDLAKLIHEVAADADFEAKSRGRKVEITSARESFIDGDESLLRRAIENVVRNAVRYTAEGTSVEISLRGTDDNGRPCGLLAVRDHGAGTPEAFIPHLFKPFYGVGDGRDRETGGAGLGLAITEAAVRLHGGAVRAVNADDGGLIVEMELPMTQTDDDGGGK
jgi:two-component system sensor histidine kinase CpxA